MTSSSSPTTAPYGSWTSNLTPEAFGQGNCGRPGEVKVHGENVFWIESNIETGKKELYEAVGGVESARRRWADGYSVQNGVHEYGGGSYVVLPTGAVLFTTVDGVFIQTTPTDEPTKLLDSLNKTRRYADFHITPDNAHFLAVEEVHAPYVPPAAAATSSCGALPEGDTNEPHPQPENRLIAVDFATQQIRVVKSGCDFYAAPRISPCGTYASWMQWNHNNMPWDETTIIVQETSAFMNGTPDDASNSSVWLRLTGEGKMINFHGPSWSVDGRGALRFHFTCDAKGHWNVYQMTGWEGLVREEQESAPWPEPEKYAYTGFVRKGLAEPVNMLALPVDIGFPPWNFADPQFAAGRTHSVFNASGVLYSLKDGELEPIHADLSHRIVSEVEQDWNTFSHMTITNSGVVYCIASGPLRAATVLRIDLNTSPVRVSAVRHSRDPSSIEAYDISMPRRLQFESGTFSIYGQFYEPKNSHYRGRPGTLPPVIIMGHSGPTLPCSTALDLKKQFFTSRGFAIFDVAYRGTSNCGRFYRQALNGKWGIVDRDDLMEASELLIKMKLVDEKKICLMGSSSSGFTLLACAIEAPHLFSAAVSIYGVADLLALVKDTHKFEMGYNETLLGKLPEAEAEYKKRSPCLHVNQLRTPVAFLHGMEDTVVPVQQSIDMFKQLRDRGITTGLLLFPGEGHGFRSAQAVKESTEAAYFFLCKAIGIEPSVTSKIEIYNLRESKE